MNERRVARPSRAYAAHHGKLRLVVRHVPTSNDRRRPKTISKETLFGSKLSIRQLSSASHSRQAAKKKYDELARQLLIGMLLNYHNPDWDPFDPSSHRPHTQSEIIKLLGIAAPE